MKSHCLRHAACALLPLAAFLLVVAPAGAATLLGPPTFRSANFVDIDRGSLEPRSRVARHVSSYAGSGGSQASVSSAFVSNASLLPTEAYGQASNTQLRSLARATGELYGSPPTPPTIVARNTSEITRFWEFSSAQGASTVDLDFLYFLEGTLETAAFAELQLPAAWSQVSLSLDAVNPAGGILASIFRVSARNSRIASGGYALSTTASGAADPVDWRDAITAITPTGGGSAYDVDYFGRFANAYTAPVGVPVGLRWTLESEAFAAGSFAFNLFLEADFRDTAEVGFEPTAGQVGVTFEEILSVPEPALAGLLAPGLGAILAVRRARRTGRGR